MPLSVGQISLTLGYTASLVWAAPILARRFDLPPDKSGSIMGTVLLASGVVGSLLGGFLADLTHRIGGPRYTINLLVALSIALIPAGFYGLMPSAVLLSILLWALCTIGTMKGIICSALASVVVPEELLGLCFGAIGTTYGVFGSLSPLAVSEMGALFGGRDGLGRSLSAVCVGTSLIGSLVLLMGRKYFPK